MKKTFKPALAKSLGRQLGINWAKVDFSPKDLAAGMAVEMEHQGGKTDVVGKNVALDVAKIALAHLKEAGDYYKRLDKMEEEMKASKSERMDLFKTRRAIRLLYDQVFGSGSYDKIPVPKSEKESEEKHDIGINKPDVMTAETHHKYTTAKKRLAKWAGYDKDLHYGKTIAAGVRKKLQERKRKGSSEEAEKGLTADMNKGDSSKCRFCGDTATKSLTMNDGTTMNACGSCARKQKRKGCVKENCELKRSEGDLTQIDPMADIHSFVDMVKAKKSKVKKRVKVTRGGKTFYQMREVNAEELADIEARAAEASKRESPTIGSALAVADALEAKRMAFQTAKYTRGTKVSLANGGTGVVVGSGTEGVHVRSNKTGKVLVVHPYTLEEYAAEAGKAREVMELAPKRELTTEEEVEAFVRKVHEKMGPPKVPSKGLPSKRAVAGKTVKRIEQPNVFLGTQGTAEDARWSEKFKEVVLRGEPDPMSAVMRGMKIGESTNIEHVNEAATKVTRGFTLTKTRKGWKVAGPNTQASVPDKGNVGKALEQALVGLMKKEEAWHTRRETYDPKYSRWNKDKPKKGKAKPKPPRVKPRRPREAPKPAKEPKAGPTPEKKASSSGSVKMGDVQVGQTISFTRFNEAITGKVTKLSRKGSAITVTIGGQEYPIVAHRKVEVMKGNDPTPIIGERPDLVDFLKAHASASTQGWARKMKREGGEHPFTWCSNKVRGIGFTDDPNAFCAAVHLAAYGMTPMQRKKSKESSEKE